MVNRVGRPKKVKVEEKKIDEGVTRAAYLTGYIDGLKDSLRLQVELEAFYTKACQKSD
jgi:hypothetical protein